MDPGSSAFPVFKGRESKKKLFAIYHLHIYIATGAYRQLVREAWRGIRTYR